MKSILVTGGLGFIGSAFIRHMLKTYPDLFIVNMDAMTYAANPDNLKGIDEGRYKFVDGNICDVTPLINIITPSRCSCIVNFAAETHVDRSILGTGRDKFEKTNISGVHNVLKIAMNNSWIERVVLVSTDEVYGSISHGSFKETDMIRPRNPYSASKAAGEMFGLAYHATYGLDVVITRGTNTYGPYQYPEKVVPLFVTNAMEGKKLPLYGDGLNVRDWLHVDDHCRAIDFVMRNGHPGWIYNVAGGNEKTNIELTKKILYVIGLDEDVIEYVEDRKGHDLRYSLDGNFLRDEGWSPEVDWEEGMEETIRWYMENTEWWKSVKSNPEYIRYYERKYGKLLKG